MSRPTPRRPASSRGTTPRPRKIAGQSGVVRPEDAQEPTTAKPTATKDRVDLTKRATREDPPVSSGTPAVEDRPGVLARQRTTRVLIASLALVALASAGQFGVLLVDRLGGDDEPTAIDDSGQISVPEGRPVVADELAVLEGVDRAAKAAQQIVAIDHKAYGEEVDKAAELMTSSFEEQYRTTAGDIEEEFVANRTTVQANVVAQGVVRANRTRLEALIFLNQVVSRERDGEPETVVTPYKVLVTMVHTDQGWFVDGLDTDAEQDKTN